jgi:aconitate hydratase
MDHMLQEWKDRALKKFYINGTEYTYYDIKAIEDAGYDLSKLPYSIRILLEGVLRQSDGYIITEDHIRNLAGWGTQTDSFAEIPFKPSRVILQDFTGVPAILDLASMRAALKDMKTGNMEPQALSALLNQINPEVQVDLVIDHSVQVDYYNSPDSFDLNRSLEFERNSERYRFLKWAQGAFNNLTIIPPSTGIVHQVNLEYLAGVVLTKKMGEDTYVYPDTLVGTDSHTTMINGLGVLGWGVGGIEAEAGMLGQPSYFPIPEVIGVRLSGELRPGATATDLALRITQLLRSKGVVSKFVEYFGEGVKKLSLADRATLANMAPEYGATCGFFPVDDEALQYLSLTGRSKEHIELVKTYLKNNSMYQEYSDEPSYTEVIDLDLTMVSSSLAGPKRPQDLILLENMKEEFLQSLTAPAGNKGHGLSSDKLDTRVDFTLADGRSCTLTTGSLVIASITSCTNTSNPSVMLGAGILAKKAVEKGLSVPSHVKTSLAPGSRVVTAYLEEAGFIGYLEQLGFGVVGYGCATCIGNSGPLLPEISHAVRENDLLVTSVLSGNRNFEGRIHSQVKANYLASPPLVIAYALAGTMNIDLTKDPLGTDQEGKTVYLKDIWPSAGEIEKALLECVKPELFRKEYSSVYHCNELWNEIVPEGDKLYRFDETSTYIRNPAFFSGLSDVPGTINGISDLRVLAKFGDSVTTDHISPAGSIGRDTPAGKYLTGHCVEAKDFNTYGSRRGNHEVMMRGTFANIRIRNKTAPGTEGGYTTYWLSNDVMSIYDASIKYQETKTGLIVLAGKDYGMGSSRDWAAKGPYLLGVKAVIAESYERIHRSNLVMMGILPLQFIEGESTETLGLSGDETYEILLSDLIKPRDILSVKAVRKDQTELIFRVVARFDSEIEVDYYRHGGILPMVLRQKIAEQK